ncbi:hypothetical protein LshimejAT787_0901790 [Lyophyllum shimeji]|uniref:Uncharacterized protein n=1 Tax=Lyophyllum shimeji TaxID=47721 RepID=A0A9P3PSZ1_LYOSH|nr:hypothetical protein LshimejAT787_0901790 [Lyophyllum shimeji]
MLCTLLAYTTESESGSSFAPTLTIRGCRDTVSTQVLLVILRPFFHVCCVLSTSAELSTSVVGGPATSTHPWPIPRTNFSNLKAAASDSQATPGLGFPWLPDSVLSALGLSIISTLHHSAPHYLDPDPSCRPDRGHTHMESPLKLIPPSPVHVIIIIIGLPPTLTFSSRHHSQTHPRKFKRDPRSRGTPPQAVAGELS